MSQTLERMVTESTERGRPGFAIAVGIVSNNFDLIAEGRVQVRIPNLTGYEPWARLSAVGGGSGHGFLWVPQVGEEVVVGFEQNDEACAYILGGLWSTINRPPLTLPPDFPIKKVLKTGIKGGLGHEVEFDDALQSIKITSSTKQKVIIDPLKIEITNTAGTLTISMDNATQTISIQAAAKLELKAAQISIEGVKVEIKGGTVAINSAGPCTVQGLPIKLN